jgi:hypothetical protein
VRAKAFTAVAAVIAIAALAVPGTAPARATPGPGKDERLVVTTFSLPGTNGYLVSVTLVNRRKLKITAIPEREHILAHLFESASTEYTLEAPQPRGSNGIVASLGRFGRIELRFEPETEVEQPAAPLGCKGDQEQIKVGQLVGRVTFRGERGYTVARSKKVLGSVVSLPGLRRKCPDESGHKPRHRSPQQRGRAALVEMARRAANPGAHLLVLGARSKAGKHTVSFAAERVSGSRKGKEIAFDTFIATAIRDWGRIKEEGTALALLVHGPYFKVPDLTRLTSEAVLAPPNPFLGSATYQRESADKVTWKGDLRVKLPGFGAVPLAGSTFKAAMCLDSGCPSE